MAWFRVSVSYEKRSNWGIVATYRGAWDKVIVSVPDNVGPWSGQEIKQAVEQKLCRWNASPSMYVTMDEIQGPYPTKQAANAGGPPPTPIPRPRQPERPDFEIQFVESVVDACDLRPLDTVREWIGEMTPTMSATRLPVVILKVKSHDDVDGPFGEARVAGPDPDYERTTMFGHDDLRARIDRPVEPEAGVTEVWGAAVVSNRLSHYDSVSQPS